MFIFNVIFFFFFFNDTATTEIYTLSLHDAFRSRPACPPCARASPDGTAPPPAADPRRRDRPSGCPRRRRRRTPDRHPSPPPGTASPHRRPPRGPTPPAPIYASGSPQARARRSRAPPPLRVLHHRSARPRHALDRPVCRRPRLHRQHGGGGPDEQQNRSRGSRE